MKTPATFALSAVTMVACLLPCTAADGDEELPMGTTSQGTNKIDYLSAKKKNMRIYKVRNTADGLFTPVKWSKDSEVFIDYNLPKCKSGTEPGPWVEHHVTTLMIEKGKTNFGYGLNKDTFTDMPDAFIRGKVTTGEEQEEKANKTTHPRLVTIFKGTIAAKKGQEYSINLTVVSEVKETGNGHELIYTMTRDEISHGLDLVPIKGSSNPFIDWESANSDEYKQMLQKRKSESFGRYAEIKFGNIKAVSVQEKTLRLMIGDEKLASYSAPAYVPAKPK
jgi:hypothetical protein